LVVEITLKDRVNPKGREHSGFSFPFLAHFLVFSRLQESSRFLAITRKVSRFLVITRKFGLSLVGKIFLSLKFFADRITLNRTNWTTMDDATRASRGAAAAGGASVVSQHSARSHQSNRSIPAVVGGGNSVHQSIIGTGNYFDDTAQRSRRVVAARKIVCPKNTRGSQGSRDYSRQHAAATAALPDLFGAAKHFRTKNAEGELAYKYKDIQSEYVGNLDKLKLYRKRLEAFNMLSPFYIPELIDPHAFSVNDRWGDRMTGCVDLTKHWSQISLKHACAWQRDTFDWCCDENDLTSMQWAKEFLTNSCDINLVKRIEEKYDYLAEYEQGGITYLKMALDEMFTMSNMVIQLLQKYLKQFAQDGIAKVPNEDVRLCSEQINAVCARLAEVNQ
jgi:hypothetical protein